MSWRVYYDDGTTWDHTQGLRDMPVYGVVCILQKAQTLDSNGNQVERYHMVYGCPFYMRSEDEWLHAYENDIIDYLTHGKTIQWLLVGRMNTKLRYGKIIRQASDDKRAENL